MDKFKERLWRELVREHGPDLARISRPARRERAVRPPLLAGTTLGLAGVGTALALALGAASTSPAFAVTENHDGTVSVVLKNLDAIHGVNARFAQLGFRARVVQAAAGCAVRPQPVVAGSLARRQVRIASVTVKQGDLNARFDPQKIPAGQMLVMGAWRQGRVIKTSSGHVVRGGAPACLPVPSPPSGVVTVVHVALNASVQCGFAVNAPSSKSTNSGPPPAGNRWAPATLNSGPPPVAGSGGNSGPPPIGGSGNSGLPPVGLERLHGPRGPGTCPAGAHALAQMALAIGRRAEAQKR
jgi:hypothetical protein